ncbi:uncharacterized protein [Oscarella lobularis]|uniref:uncharacterized protein n=1 Tax=Oscarella lobularis TaxID=121494 RepID=UPI003313607C
MDTKRKLSSTSDGDALMEQEEDVPRKKSRNYLDSHKSIEKKRRDRINNSLTTIKELVPDCKQYGTKKLDKAEILEMCIDYLRRLQAHFAQHGGEALATSPRDFAAEISSWVLQHKQQHTELDSFIQALLLYLSTYGSVVAQRQQQQQIYVSGQTHQATDLLSPIAANLSGMTIMTSSSVDPPHCVASFPPPYHGIRGLDTHHQTPQVHRPPTSSAQQRFGDDPQMQDLWRTQAMMQHMQQQQQQQQGFHSQTGTDHDPPPLVQPPPDSISAQDVAKATATQPLHHLVMQQPGGAHQAPYSQMIVLQQQQAPQPQASTRPLHHPSATAGEEANHQIQQFLDAYTKSSATPILNRGGASGEVQMINAQDIVHHQIQQQMRMAQHPSPPPSQQQQSQQSQQPPSSQQPPISQAVSLVKTDEQNVQSKTPLPGTETLVMGIAPQAPATSLTEELLDSGTSVAAQSETTNVSDIVESESWGATQVAMETTVADTSWKMEDEAERAKDESTEGEKKSDEQSASTLLMLASGEKKEEQETSSSPPPAAAAAVAAEDDPSES